jgi:serine/threonine protein phosphatase PrpC
MAHERKLREDLYRDFIVEASTAYGDARLNSEPRIPDLVSLYAMMTDLTARQRRRPLLGSGEALPVQFEAERGGGRLLLASDGLVKYATVERICALAIQGTVSEAATALANSVRLPSGALQDDVAVVIVSG